MFPLVLSAALAQPADQPHSPAEPVCRVLAKGDDYVVHAVPSGPRAPGQDASGGPWGFGRLLGGRYTILHTDRKTGALKKLVEGGEWSVPGPPMGIDRVTHHSLTIAAAAGPDRLYVLVMRSTTHAFAQGAPGPIDRTRAQIQHVLYVFRLADGSTVQEVVLPEPRERLAGFARNSVEPELIRVTPTTVTVGTAVYRTGERLELVESKP